MDDHPDYAKAVVDLDRRVAIASINPGLSLMP